MKILVYTDNHFSQYSSILRKRGSNYSIRLENQIESLNWVQKVAVDNKCSCIYCLGDFFDQSSLNAEELTALKEIKWASIPNYFLVGNHELGNADATFNSTHLLNLNPNAYVINRGALFDLGKCNLLCLPYQVDIKPLSEYTQSVSKDKPLIVFSHNDVKGIQYGAFISTQGLDVQDIEKECNLFINGHIHNYSQFCRNGYNLGNLTGQNFSEDATRYGHYIIVLDTDTFQIQFIENPYALNFYKLDFTESSDTDISTQLNSLKSNAVVTVKVNESQLLVVREKLQQCSSIIESRVLLQMVVSESLHEDTVELIAIDHKEQFKKYIVEKLGNSDIVLDELTKVCEG